MKCKRLETDGYWNKSVKQQEEEQEQGSTARR